MLRLCSNDHRLLGRDTATLKVGAGSYKILVYTFHSTVSHPRQHAFQQSLPHESETSLEKIYLLIAQEYKTFRLKKVTALAKLGHYGFTILLGDKPLSITKYSKSPTLSSVNFK